jgi:hypothetical protein
MSIVSVGNEHREGGPDFVVMRQPINPMTGEPIGDPQLARADQIAPSEVGEAEMPPGYRLIVTEAGKR